jgi:succinate-semialdehyde dehydrogenase/glutarate-semialdehyde dehydrogenase
MKVMRSVNPATGELNGEYEIFSPEKVENALKRSRVAFKEWKDTEVFNREYYLDNAAGVLRERAQELAQTITMEMGKPIRESLDEIEKCAKVFDYFSEQAEVFLSPEFVETEAEASGIVLEPLGTILSIMPWNAPFWQALRFAAPALAGGNVVLLKHASYVPKCALAIESIFKEAEFPEGAYQTLLIDGPTALSIIPRNEINAVSFTGSREAGQKVAAAAGGSAKKCLLELGGSDPFIVLDDADIKKAAKEGVKSRFQNAGQRCTAAKRFIVDATVAEDFTSKFLEHVRDLKIGDPFDLSNDMGPLVNSEQADFVQDQVDRTLKVGADVLLDGGKQEGKGSFFYPVVLGNITESAPVLTEETFGPVAPIVIFRNEDDAIKIANSTEFGLGASIWSKDRERAVGLSREIEAGLITINNSVSSDPRLPLGGFKKSGFGRELHWIGMYEFLGAKSMKVF